MTLLAQNKNSATQDNVNGDHNDLTSPNHVLPKMADNLERPLLISPIHG